LGIKGFFESSPGEVIKHYYELEIDIIRNNFMEIIGISHNQLLHYCSTKINLFLVV